MSKINCFVAGGDPSQVQATVDSLNASSLVNKVYILVKDKDMKITGGETLMVDSVQSSRTISRIAGLADTDYTLLYLKETALDLGQFALERFSQVMADTAAGMVYSDYYEVKSGVRSAHPVVDYQEGSVRDDFNFGSVLFIDSKKLKSAAGSITGFYRYAGWYDLRLKISQDAPLFHINEYLYTEVELDTRKSGEKQFDYVDPKNRDVQLEMESACTDHLKAIGAYLEPEFSEISFDDGEFPVQASVIIPVRNRVKTLEDAIRSVLTQKTGFEFNLIIVDNYSTDGTTELIRNYVEKDRRVIHVVPERTDLGIGGCWNEGVHHATCGKFAVQLDSDDVYQNEKTLQTIVDAFYSQNCAMVVGSYTMTNFAMETIAPGLIDHKEWTPENGRNNALRINGLGAPRAFYTPVLRLIKVPNTSYGEDYALGLRISRYYRIGRVYESLYLCRRWEDNSDASLDVVKMNGYNLYKDKIRTVELLARKALNKYFLS